MTHTHECRRCGTEIDCDLPACDELRPTGPTWEGDNVGCPNELAELELELELNGGRGVELAEAIDRLRKQQQR
jgi:hypothetical protein